MYKEEIKLSYLLDLFQAGQSCAYLSVINSYSKDNQPLQRIEMVVPNVGSLRLYQTFIEQDEQIPVIKIFYTFADRPSMSSIIYNKTLFYRALKIVYDCKKYCELRPYTEFRDDTITKKIIKNKKLAHRIYSWIQAKRANTWSGRFLHR